MKQVTLTTYNITELEPQAQRKAIDWFLRDGSYIDLDIDQYQDMLIEHGFINAQIHYSGFYSQGDGASFTADMDKKTVLVGQYYDLTIADFDLVVDVVNSSYSHERTKRVETIIYDATDDKCELITQLQAELEELRINLCHRIYNGLCEQYDYQTSDKYVIAACMYNEYEFLIDGSLYDSKWSYVEA